MTYPSNFEDKIGFTQIRAMLQTHCLSTLGTDRIGQIQFMTDASEIRRQHELTREFMAIIQGDADFPDQYYLDMRAPLRRIRVEGTWLDQEELLNLRRSLGTIMAITRFLLDAGEEEANHPDATGTAQLPYPSLASLASQVPVFPQLTRRIDAILDKEGRVKDSASAELARIRRELAITEGSISRTLHAILRGAQQEGIVDKDAAPAMRDGRLVIPVAPALKRKIRGIVHDESATGRTVYIEPAEVVEANNRIRELQGEERREVIRILKAMTDEVRPQQPLMLTSYQFLAEIEFVRAKSRLALQTDAIAPAHIQASPLIDWVQARHPLLQHSLARHGSKVVPLDIALDKDHRILIVSGPNAGGKSVCLKTVGLLQYMLQCGLPVPMRENSRTGVFGSIFMDMGDEQSIEDDLSTYSSHLLNMKQMMRHATGTSLLLIDEFGSGTEPMIGGAIAQAVLTRLNDKGAYGVITTHYQNLKHFADNHEGVINGAMLYDRQLMQPLFQLQTGNPGSSFAIEIARKTGLPEDVIAEATNLVGQDYIDADKYLLDIVRDKRYWENKRQTIRQREKEMEHTMTRYETEIEQLQRSKREIMEQARSEAQQLLKEANARIENTIREIREAQADKERTLKARQELNDFRQTVEGAPTDSDDDLIDKKMRQLQERKQRKAQRKAQKDKAGTHAGTGDAATRPQSEAPLAPGDSVCIKGQNCVGTLEKTDGHTATVLFGMMRTKVQLSKLQHAERPKEQPKAATSLSRETREAMTQKKLNFRQDIDVRGMRADEALTAVTYFIDDALQVGAARVRILHGTGSGILRTLIRQYLAAVTGVRNAHDEHVQFGGAGITVVELA